MSKLPAHPMPTIAWSGMTALAVVEPTLVCLSVLKLVQASDPGASEQQLLLALLYALPVALLDPARRALVRLLPANAERRPMLLVWTAGISSTVITWHAAAQAALDDLCRELQPLAEARLEVASRSRREAEAAAAAEHECAVQTARDVLAGTRPATSPRQTVDERSGAWPGRAAAPCRTLLVDTV